LAAAIVLAATTANAAEMRIERDIQYGPSADAHQTLLWFCPLAG
jgi:hypothetical protein